jgi:spermidine/putrescine transport system ATP-binding protein
MNRGRFEQVGSPQALYYEPHTPFVAGFVGANNRLAGRAAGIRGDLVELVTPQGLTLFARRHGTVAAGDAVEAFVRPEVALLARDAAGLPAGLPPLQAAVQSLLFDGANSAVLLREARTGLELRVALPQTGQFADLRVGEAVVVAFDPERAVCFRAAAQGG